MNKNDAMIAVLVKVLVNEFDVRLSEIAKIVPLEDVKEITQEILDTADDETYIDALKELLKDAIARR